MFFQHDAVSEMTYWPLLPFLCVETFYKLFNCS